MYRIAASAVGNDLTAPDAFFELVQALEAYKGSANEVWQDVRADRGAWQITATLTSPDGSLGRIRARITVQVVPE